MPDWITRASSRLRTLTAAWRTWWAHAAPTEAEMETRAFVAGRDDYARGLTLKECPFVGPEEQELWRRGFDYENRVEMAMW